MPSSLEGRLKEIKTQLQALPTSKEPPPTMLQILGRSQLEQDWQRLLFHFLSPDASHGFDHALLEHVLSALADRGDVEFAFSRADLTDVTLQREVATARGRPDAVLWAGTDWFICWELKVTASEGDGQTQAYVDVESFHGIGLDKADVAPGGETYVYVAPADAPPPSAEAFVHITWEWVASQLQSFLADSHGTYPAASTAHLTDFISTIKRELTMTEYQENQAEKARLYVEYYDEIEALQAAFESQWETFADTWGSQLASTIADAEIVEIPDLPGTHVAIELPETAGDPDRWLFRQGSSDWAGIMKEGWWLSKDDFATIYQSSDEGDDVRITFYHRLTENRRLAVKDRTLELQLWHGTGNGDDFMYRFRDTLSDKMDHNPESVPAAVEYTGKRGNPVTATYEIPTRDHDDFFEAYVTALNEAFRNLAVEHPGFIDLIEESLTESLAVYDA